MIMPVPFLWVIPLALYLVSFIISFREGFRLPFWLNESLVVLAGLATLLILSEPVPTLLLSLAVVHLTLMAIYHWCHEHLYAKRPAVENLPSFYMALALGGIFGSLVITLSSYFILPYPFELFLLLATSLVFISLKWVKSDNNHWAELNKTLPKIVTGGIILTVLFLGFLAMSRQTSAVIAHERNFYGFKKVVTNNYKGHQVRSLANGTTNHGFQVIDNGELLTTPTAYYVAGSGIGLAFAYLKDQSTTPLNVLVAGLGSGALAGYCQAGDHFSFVEIDEQVVELANNYFTFLKNCAGAEVVLSDARLKMQEIANANGKEQYNLVVIDVYADDMVPAHLLTQEALALYKNLIQDNGLIAVHISSRYLELLPVLKGGLDANGLVAYYFSDQNPQEYGSQSLWVLLSKNDQPFTNEILKNMSNLNNDNKIDTVLWTDTYSALWPVVKF